MHTIINLYVLIRFCTNFFCDLSHSLHASILSKCHFWVVEMLVVEPVISVSEDHQSLFELISFPVCHLSLAGAKYHCFAYHLLRYTAETCKELCIHIFGWHCWQHSKLIASFSRYCKLKRRQLTLFKLVLF